MAKQPTPWDRAHADVESTGRVEMVMERESGLNGSIVLQSACDDLSCERNVVFVQVPFLVVSGSIVSRRVAGDVSDERM